MFTVPTLGSEIITTRSPTGAQSWFLVVPYQVKFGKQKYQKVSKHNANVSGLQPFFSVRKNCYDISLPSSHQLSKWVFHQSERALYFCYFLKNKGVSTVHVRLALQKVHRTQRPNLCFNGRNYKLWLIKSFCKPVLKSLFSVPTCVPGFEYVP